MPSSASQKKNCRCYFSYENLNTTPLHTSPSSNSPPTPHSTLINWRMRKEQMTSERERESKWLLGFESILLCCWRRWIGGWNEGGGGEWCKAMLLYLCLNYQIPFAKKINKKNGSSIKKSMISSREIARGVRMGSQLFGGKSI